NRFDVPRAGRELCGWVIRLTSLATARLSFEANDFHDGLVTSCPRAVCTVMLRSADDYRTTNVLISCVADILRSFGVDPMKPHVTREPHLIGQMPART